MEKKGGLYAGSTESIQWNWKTKSLLELAQVVRDQESIQWNWKKETGVWRWNTISRGSNPFNGIESPNPKPCQATSRGWRIHSMELKASTRCPAAGTSILRRIHSMELKALHLHTMISYIRSLWIHSMELKVMDYVLIVTVPSTLWIHSMELKGYRRRALQGSISRQRNPFNGIESTISGCSRALGATLTNPFNGIERAIDILLEMFTDILRIHSMELKALSTHTWSLLNTNHESIQWNWKISDFHNVWFNAGCYESIQWNWKQEVYHVVTRVAVTPGIHSMELKDA